MKRILRIGMDVHSTNYTLCAMEPVIGEEDRIFATVKVTPDYRCILSPHCFQGYILSFYPEYCIPHCCFHTAGLIPKFTSCFIMGKISVA